jgi:UDPglucose 6-dehydrogenase
MQSIGFIGLGKLGLDCAEVFAQHYTVRGYDTGERTSTSVIIAPLEQVVHHSDWLFVAVPTPHADGYDGSTPSSHLEPRDFGHDAVIEVLNKINHLAQSPKKIVLISTVLPGTTRSRFVDLLDARHQFLYNPYLIAMGSVKWDMVNPEMVIIGTCDGDRSQLAQELIDLYRPVMSNDPRYVVGTWEEAESVKIFYNTFISAKVGLANMIQDFAMRIGHINVDVVTDALAASTMRIMGPKYMTAGMGDAGACHPRDNIALRWLAQEYDLGYDLFDTIMRARELQAKNLADFLCGLAVTRCCPVVIHGKAYKPDVPYCIGSYSTLVGHYIQERRFAVTYVDPLADDREFVVDAIPSRAIVLMAHNRQVTYGYTGQQGQDPTYCAIPAQSVIVDPWRRWPKDQGMEVIYYGNTREQ